MTGISIVPVMTVVWGEVTGCPNIHYVQVSCPLSRNLLGVSIVEHLFFATILVLIVAKGFHARPAFAQAN